MPDSNNKGGRKPRVTDEDLLDVFRATPDPVLSTAEVADAVPIKRRGTLNRLQALEEDGELESKQIGGRNTVWWFVGGDRITPDERAVEEDAEKPREESDVVDRVAGDKWEDASGRLEARKAAARAVLDYARKHGEVSKQEAKEEVYPEYPVEEQTARTWYRKTIRPVLNEVAEYNQSTRAYQLAEGVDT